MADILPLRQGELVHVQCKFASLVCTMHVHTVYSTKHGVECIPYSQKFSLDKHFANPSYPCITEIFTGINFRQCGKGRHILCVIINTGQKIHRIKISPMQAGGEIGETFLLAKIFSYTVYGI